MSFVIRGILEAEKYGACPRIRRLRTTVPALTTLTVDTTISPQTVWILFKERYGDIPYNTFSRSLVVDGQPLFGPERIGHDNLEVEYIPPCVGRKYLKEAIINYDGVDRVFELSTWYAFVPMTLVDEVVREWEREKAGE